MKPLKLKIVKKENYSDHMKQLESEGFYNCLGFHHLWIYPLSGKLNEKCDAVLVSYDKGRTVNFAVVADLAPSIHFYVVTNE